MAQRRDLHPRIPLALALALALVAGALPANAFLLKGTVYADSSPFAGARVELHAGGAAEVIGSVVTPAGGGFSFPAGAGTYDLLVTAAGYQPSSVKGIVVAAGDVTQDVALIGKVSLSGVLRTAEGVPVAGARITVYGADPDNEDTWGWPLAERVLTDGSGAYSFPLVPSGIVMIDALNEDDPDPGFPSFWVYSTEPFALAGALARDVTLPRIATVSGKVTGPDGVPVRGAGIAAGNVNSSVWYAHSESRPAVTNGAGEYAVRVFATGETHVTATPPPDKEWSRIVTDLDVRTDVAKDFAFTTISLRGVVRNAEGVPVPGARVTLRGGGDANWGRTVAGPVVTNGKGAYAFALVPSGDVMLDVFKEDDGDPRFPSWWIYHDRAFAIAETTTRDLTLPPVATISGRMTDVGGAPVPGVEVAARNYGSGAGWEAQSKSRIATSNAAGAYAVRVFALGGTHVTATPPPERGWSRFEDRVDVRADLVKDYVFTAVSLSGRLRTAEGVPVAGAAVYVRGGDSGDDPTGGHNFAGPVVTDREGAYAFPLVPQGAVTLDVVHGEDGEPLVPAEWFRSEGPFTISGTMERDMTLPPVAAVSGTTTDANGVPVPGVRVEAHNNASGHGSYTWSRSRVATSDAGGAYAVRAFATGRTAFTLKPPDGSGFERSAPIRFSLTGDQRFNALLMLADTAPPLILTGPVAARITDTAAVIEWQTDEPARGGVFYGAGDAPATPVDESDYATVHAVPLAGLLPGTTYFAGVFATDRAGNGPVRSGVIAFTTLAAADVTPPVFVFGPIVGAVTQDTARVEWATNEASSCTVFFGEPGGPEASTGDGLLDTAHHVTLAGLAPARDYELHVDCADGFGNVAGSVVVAFTTAPAADTTPPVIVEGPLVVDVTDTTATVIWTTDEPATSGVSWNDGTKFGLISDPALVIRHSATLTGLLPATAYVLTVSTTDGAGNGPTLAGPLPFRTAPARDTNPPAIVDGPTVVNVTHQSAVIRWETDEPADGVVEYGLAADRLLLHDAHGTLTRPHNQTLTGLDPDREYFFRVCSTDAAGNTGCSEVASFRTDDGPRDRSPAVIDGPTVAYASDRTVTVTWTTDVPTSSLVQYQASGGAVRQRSDGDQVLRHQVTLKGLAPETAYALRVSGADARGGEAALPAGAMTAGEPDTAPPVIIAGPTVVCPKATQAVVAWTTDELADSVVRYARSGSGRKLQAGSITRTREHRVVLTNLVPDGRYELRVLATDPEGNGPTGSGLLSFTATPAPVFTDGFADGTPAGDPEWLVAAGAWTVAGERYVSRKSADNLSCIAGFDPDAGPFTVGEISARITLTGAGQRRANGSIVFSFLDPARYRYVRLEEGRVVIGQVGDFPGVRGGAKKVIAAGIALNRARTLAVKVFPDGWVRVFLGGAKVGAWKFPATVPGGIGVAAMKAVTIFDDVNVWDAGKLVP